MVSHYWRDNPGAEWTTLLRTVETYCHPEAAEDAYESLQRLAKRTDLPKMRLFKEELVAAIRDPGRLPDDELFEAAAFSDGTDAAFLARLWRDLYPEEALPEH